ncbi:MAG: bifunctional oligoribonuclease/PAP phosphatase NrnA [Eubacterium sp.]|nr:bifunctional oligoribonuclease/PAP phosphatase NrnA [Eubacterium sp.]
MKDNNTFAEIAKALSEAEKILIFTHQNMDGDALGSSCAMAHNLRLLGKECWVMLNDDDIMSNLRFLAKDYCTTDENVMGVPDVSLILDASSPSRFPAKREKFEQGKLKIAVDHHLVDAADLDMKYIDAGSASTGELVFELLKEMGVAPDRETAEALFAAAITDTGRFTYSNTTAGTHEMIAELYSTGFDAAGVSVELYESENPSKVLMHARVLSGMEMLEDGKVAIARLSQQLLKETGAALSDTDGIVATLRAMKGVEIAAFLKEGEDGKSFVSLRSKNDADVAVIAKSFGGGGHKKAAGATLDMSLDEAYELVKKVVTEAVRK